MSAWHDPDRTLVNIFLEKSQFRSGSRPTYRWFLRSFEDAARCHPAVDRQMLTAWLRDMEKRWRLRTLLRQQPHRVVAQSVQRQTKQADLEGAGFAQSRRGLGRVTTAGALRQRTGGLHARPCHADAQQGISI